MHVHKAMQPYTQNLLFCVSSGTGLLLLRFVLFTVNALSNIEDVSARAMHYRLILTLLHLLDDLFALLVCY